MTRTDTCLSVTAVCCDAGVIGLVLLLYFGANSAFCGYTLSRCWLIVESRYPELQEQVRAPYPEIAYRAYGTPFK